MKKISLLLIATILSINMMGQIVEGQGFIAESKGIVNGKLVLKVTNKLQCINEVEMGVGRGAMRVFILQSGQTDTVHIFPHPVIQIYGHINCICNDKECKELRLPLGSLPVNMKISVKIIKQ